LLAQNRPRHRLSSRLVIVPETTQVACAEQHPAHFATQDGISLRGTWFVPAGSATAVSTAIVITCGAGIPAKYYRHFAQYLAGQGAAVLTYDYRGIDASREGSIRGLKAGMEHWAELDFGAALAEARTTYSHLPVSAIAHSVGAVFIGAAADAPQLNRIVLLGPHTGYWRDYGARWRWALFLVWHLFMPAVTRLFGYFPGRLLHLGEDLPPQVALDWARRRQPELVATPEDALRFARLLSRFPATRADTLVLSISDDAFAPPAAARRLLSMYPNIQMTHETTTPASLGHRRLGHFGFLRRSSGRFFWRRAAEWLIVEAPEKNI
jgi:predicted alpha/beta hydrolase